MAQFIAFDPRVEVNGQTALSVVNAVADTFKTNILAILKKNGLENIQPEEWYNQQAWLDTFRDISDKIGANTLFAIGKAIPENAIFPPEIDNLQKALASIDIAYHMNHRYGEIGYYKLVSYDAVKRKAIMECRNPYPCHFDRGIITTMARKFKPKDSIHPEVALDITKPNRLNGAESSTYIVTW